MCSTKGPGRCHRHWRCLRLCHRRRWIIRGTGHLIVHQSTPIPAFATADHAASGRQPRDARRLRARAQNLFRRPIIIVLAIAADRCFHQIQPATAAQLVQPKRAQAQARGGQNDQHTTHGHHGRVVLLDAQVDQVVLGAGAQAHRADLH